MKNYFVYITTNPDKKVLYENRGKAGSFTGEYYCYKLIYWEKFSNAKDAIARDTQLKNWSKKKKENLIALLNPNWMFLNDEAFSEGAF